MTTEQQHTIDMYLLMAVVSIFLVCVGLLITAIWVDNNDGFGNKLAWTALVIFAVDVVIVVIWAIWIDER